MLFFIAGASGSGKTACIPYLKKSMPDAKIFDFDDIGVPENPDKVWRQQSTEKWLQRYLNDSDKNRIYCICGQVVLGEILACPSASKINKINICLLDVKDIERIHRLRSRNTYGANQDMLNWSAWLRLHHHDPSWHQNVIMDNAWENLNFEILVNLKSWNALANVTMIDTTLLNIQAVSNCIKDWISNDSHTNYGKAIFLNGPSSSGKTSIAKKLQEKLSKPFMHIGIDKLIGMMPAHLNDWEGGKVEEGFFWEKEYDNNGNEVHHIQMGPYAKKVNALLKCTAVMMLNSGFNIIVDDVCLDSDSFNQWKNILTPFQVFYVGITTPINILEEREKNRGDRIAGSARAQCAIVHQNKFYDLLIDSSIQSIDDCVNKIIDEVQQ